MGTTFVTIDNSTGFWMRDGILELWLRLLSLNIEETPDEEFLGRKIRDQWLLASKGYFGGHVPHDLETFGNTEQGRQIVRMAIESLMTKLKNAQQHLDGPTLDLLGIGGTLVHPLETRRLIDGGQAFLNLIDGRINSDCRSTEFMPGSKVAT